MALFLWSFATVTTYQASQRFLAMLIRRKVQANHLVIACLVATRRREYSVRANLGNAPHNVISENVVLALSYLDRVKLYTKGSHREVRKVAKEVRRRLPSRPRGSDLSRGIHDQLVARKCVTRPRKKEEKKEEKEETTRHLPDLRLT